MKYGNGQTPIEQEEIDELIPFWITKNFELNNLEQQNIANALSFFKKRKPKLAEILSLQFIKKLHHKMFCDVWKWAGKFRKTEKNIGVWKRQIATATYSLLNDVEYWVNNHIFSKEEIAIRCKHRLVSIHPFPNGNGRHSRVYADLLIHSLGQREFTWGKSLKNPREEYLSALRKADQNFYQALIAFARK